MEFINKLPYECKRKWLESIEKELDPAEESKESQEQELKHINKLVTLPGEE